MGGIGRRLPDGSVDSNFAVDLINNGPYLSSHPRFIKVLDGGDILIAGGFDDTSLFGSAALARLTSTGEDVAAFNNNVGAYLLGDPQNPGSPPEVYDIEIDAQGRILMAVQSYVNTYGALVRFGADGTPDQAFNSSFTSWMGDGASGIDLEVVPGGGYLLTTDFSGANNPAVDILSPGHPWGGDCGYLNLFKVNSDGTSNTTFNGTYDANGVCGTRTVVGGTFATDIGVPNLNAYTGVASDVGVSTGDWSGVARGVEIDGAGQILITGKFYNTGWGQAPHSGLIRLDTDGSFSSFANPGQANWSGWDIPNGAGRGSFVLSSFLSGDTLVVASNFQGAKIKKFSGNPQPAPTVTSVSPTSGATAGGTAITITGTNFTGASAVTVGSAACTNVVVVSATSITCTTPTGTAGTASVVVTSGGQSNAVNTLFTYNAPTTTTTPATSAPATTAPATAAPVGPVNVTSSNQATLTQTPGGATAIVNGQPVTVAVETPADLPAAQVDPEDRSPAQVAALQTAADNLVSQLNQAAGGNSGLAVQDTPTGAAITGLLDKPVPIENTVLVEAGTKSTLFAALNQDGSVTEVQPGAVIEVLGDGQVGVVASGLTPGETAEFVIMSTPTLLGSYTVSANGTIKAQTSLPDGIGLGNHTLVVASPTVQASLGLKVSATPSTLPATGASSSNTMQIAMWLLVGGLMVAFLRRRRHILN
jgi:LPXTG-motif cell wall-anchored protein